jgi:hypothetical protein
MVISISAPAAEVDTGFAHRIDNFRMNAISRRSSGRNGMRLFRIGKLIEKCG